MTVQSLIKQTIALEPLLYCIWKIKKKKHLKTNIPKSVKCIGQLCLARSPVQVFLRPYAVWVFAVVKVLDIFDADVLNATLSSLLSLQLGFEHFQ